MAANTQAILVLNPNTSTATIAAANTARDGSGTLVTAFTAGVNGSRVDSIDFINAQATPAASSALIWRVFITDTAGANPRLYKEYAQITVTASNTVIGAAGNIPFGNGLLLLSGQIIKVSQSVYAGAQDQTHVIVRGGDY